MSWRNVKLIFAREVRDQLRDRRTLFMVAVLPLLLYPAMGIGMVQLTVMFSEQSRTVVILGADELPPPPLVEKGRLAAKWFHVPADAAKLRIITDDNVNNESAASDSESRDAILAQADQLRTKVEALDELNTALKAAQEAKNTAEIGRIETELDRFHSELSKLFAASEIQVLMIVPTGFGKHIAQINEQLANRTLESSNADVPRLVIVQNSADEKSSIAYGRVKQAIEAWEQEILKQRLERANLPQTLPKPINPAPIDLAEEKQIAANIWSKLLPAMLVVMAVTGAFYPAVDVAAGEKERGTMETLLICPATRSEIVVGKFFTVMLFSMSTALLNLVSMALTGKYMASIVGQGAMSKIGDLAMPSFTSLVWVVILLIPLSALFSALCLALATFARSSKEGQYYQMPLLIVTLGLTVFCLSPGVSITPFYSVMPIMGAALLLKSLLLSPLNPVPLYLYGIPVLATSIAYSLLALWWAIDQFSREDVLFREAERFEFRLWLRHLLRDKERLPSFAEAGFCFVLIMLLQFAAISVFRSENPLDTDRVLQLLMIQQLVIVATPALLMSVMLTTSVRDTLRLHWPGAGELGLAAMFAVSLHPLSLELLKHMQWFFQGTELPEGIEQVMQAIKNPNVPIWLLLLAFAALPAICEELTFRGFILSGFSRAGRVGLAIAMSAVCFGIMHMIPQQVFNATLLGLVLGLVAVRTNSLFPGILFHFVYNSLGVMNEWVPMKAPKWLDSVTVRWFMTVEDGHLDYRWPTLVLAFIVAVVLLQRLLVANRRGKMTDSLSSSNGDQSESREHLQPPISVG